ncbi:MAG: response regulator transcription factor [Bdellovibrionales bacterium]|nr:response regulator transcription factor [Bdellovibrionales bacterium]
MGDKKNILIIEDDRDILEVLKDILESEGYTVATAENGKMGIEVLQSLSEPPKLVLLDLMMPIMDGFQFRQEQLKNDAFKTIPVVVMSADGRMELKKDRIGVDIFLKKPLDLETVLDTVSGFF